MSSVTSSRWSTFVSTRLIISISTVWSGYCYAEEPPDCIMHVYNPNTGKMECSGIALVETNLNTSSDIKAIRLVMICGFVIFLIVLLYHIARYCCTSFGRMRHNVRIPNNYWADPSQDFPSAPEDPYCVALSLPVNVSKQCFSEAQLPMYPEPPKYHECVALNFCKDKNEKDAFPG